MLTPKYSVTFEPSIQYTNISSSQVALLGYTIVPSVTIGVITVQDVNDDMFIAAMAFRFGITNRSELEFKVPYVYRNNASASSPVNAPVNPSVFNADGYGFGDLEATLRYQLNQPVGPGGIYIASLRAKARNGTDPFEVPYNPVAEGVAGAGLPTELPVGSGFYSVQPAITMIYPADPADAYRINFGMGIGLNENFSFSLGYDHVVLGTSTRDGNRLGNSKTTQVASLLLGTTYRINKRTNLNISLGIGATSPAPDVQFTMKMPINFF